IASWVETGGRRIYPGNPSPTSIRNYTRFSEKKSSKTTMLLKISCTSITMHDILKHALAIYAWQCRGSGDYPSRRTTYKGFYGCQNRL
ncbi:MAG: hypothetical protein OXI67_11770, partial [Candidatus Poribacteria bacterium]|nr:hypothetical protein [Candidatus Poribacteria bacterium]